MGTGSSVYGTGFATEQGDAGVPYDSQTLATLFQASGTGTFSVSQIDLGIESFSPPHIPSTLTAGLWTDNSSGSFPEPGTELGSWDLTATDTTGCCALTSKTGITGVTLTGGALYFIVVGPEVITDNTVNGWMYNTTGATTPYQLWSFDGGANWGNGGSGTQNAFDVLGDPTTPEPSSLLLLAPSLAGLLLARKRKVLGADRPLFTALK